MKHVNCKLKVCCCDTKFISQKFALQDAIKSKTLFGSIIGGEVSSKFCRWSLYRFGGAFGKRKLESFPSKVFFVFVFLHFLSAITTLNAEESRKWKWKQQERFQNSVAFYCWHLSKQFVDNLQYIFC